MITDMSKIEIVAPSKYHDELIDFLQNSGVLHIETIPDSLVNEEQTSFKMMDFDDSEKDRRLKLESIRRKLDEMVAILPLNLEKIPVEFINDEKLKLILKNPQELESLLEILRVKLNDLNRQKMSLKAQLTSLEMYGKTARAFIPLMLDMKSDKEREFIGIIIEKKHSLILRLLINEIDKITNNTGKVLSSAVDSKADVAIIAFNKEYRTQIKKLLFDEGLPELAVPSELIDMPLSQAITFIMERGKTLPQEIGLIEAQIRSVLRNDGARILAAQAIVNDQISQIEVRKRFASSKFAFMLHGWMPSDKIDDLRKKVLKYFGDQVVISRIKLTHHDHKNAPVKLENINFVKPFELAMSVYPLPKYGTIDPTKYVAFFFPIFFGFILGDVGYGLFVFLLGCLLKKKLSHIKAISSVTTILNWMAFYSIIFGILFGEFFGDLIEKFGIHPIFNRAEAVNLLIAITIGIGVFQVFFGLILGYINAMKIDHKKEGYARLNQLSGLICIFLMVLGPKIGLPSVLNYFFGLVIAINVVTLLKLEGIIGPIEILSYVGNIFSYARIAAIGLSSVFIAIIANKMVSICGSLLGGVLGTFLAGLFGIVVALMFHILNLVIGIFSPTIHSMRLHFVEFFTKFYQMGGIPYKPFKKFGGE
jgi:V/A-type H+/Na+-transporting ATPase subunit I